MKISIIGSGYVGLVSGACFAEFGVEVTCIDKDKNKIKSLRNGVIPIYEPGLDDLVKKNLKEKRIKFETNLPKGIRGASAIFIAVGTPARRGDGHADLSFVYNVAEEIAISLNEYAVIINKSTVPVGTGKKVFEIIQKNIRGKNLKFDVASNPEFLREGSAINDFMRPDRVVIGCQSEKAVKILKELYRPLYLLETPILFTKRETAELIKYAANSFLATKISFINEIADLCEKVGANVSDVATGIGLDGRIGKKFLHPGPGYGGSCFPKDTLALVKTAQDYKSRLTLVEQVVSSNKNLSENFITKDNVLHLKINSQEAETNIMMDSLYQYNPEINHGSHRAPYTLTYRQIKAHVLLHEKFFKNISWYRYINDEVLKKMDAGLKHKKKLRRAKYLETGI